MSNENTEQAPDDTDAPGAYFSQTLASISYGDAADSASTQLADLVKAVQEHEREGKLTVELTVKPRGKDSGQVEVTAKITSKQPVREIAPSMFFTTEDGGLVRDNPRQKKFPFADTPQRVKKTGTAGNN